MPEIVERQCWAFHRDGARCQHPAGHPGNHVIERTWTDLECATPGEFLPAPATLMTDTSETHIVLPSIPKPIPAAVGCTACSHKHKGGECKCGCYEFIG